MNKYEKTIYEFLLNVWKDINSLEKIRLYEIFSKQLIINSPLEGRKLGAKNFKKINDRWEYGFPSQSVTKLELSTFGNVVSSRWQCKGMHINDFEDIPATGKTITYSGEEYYIFENEKIVRYSCMIDMMYLYQQLGYEKRLSQYPGKGQYSGDKEKLKNELNNRLNAKISSREIENFGLYLYGFTSKQIGKILNISSRTVETHIQRALNELGCRSKGQCVEQMYENGLLPLWKDLGALLAQQNKNVC